VGTGLRQWIPESEVLVSFSRKFGLATAWVVYYPWLAYLFIVLMSGLALVGYYSPYLVIDLFRSPPPVAVASATPADATPATPREAPPSIDTVNLSGSDAVLVIESEDIFTPDGTQALRQLVETLEDLPYVSKVFWMDRMPVLNLFGLNEPLLPRPTATPQRFADAREKALAHPFVKGQLLSPDGKTLLMLVEFDWLFVSSDDQCTTGLRQAAEAALKEFPKVRASVGVTGHLPIHLTIMQTHEANEVKYRVIGYGMVLVMAVVLFRGLTAVIIVASAPAVGVFWSLGVLQFFQVRDNPFNDVVLPVILSLIGLTDGVHLIVQVRRFRAAGLPDREAVRSALEEVGMASFLTAVTTSIGFWSLSLAKHEIIQEFGWSCVLGVILTFIAVILVIPLACLSPLGRLVPMVNERGFIERNLFRVSGMIDLVLRYPRQVSYAGILLTAVGALISAQLRPDERRSSYLPASAEATKALHQMDRAMGGLEFSNVDIRWSDKIDSDSPEVLQVVQQVDDLLHGETLIGSPLSIRTLLDALPGDGPVEDRASMLDLLPPELKRAFYIPENRNAWVTFRVQDLGIAAYGEVFKRVESGLTAIETQHPEFDLVLGGSAVWRWRNLYQIVVDLGSSLGSESLIIFITLGFAYRSLRLGLIAMVPNVFPLGVTGVWLYFTGQSLEVVTVCAFTVCLGIAVDDTIHFLTRFKEELPRSSSREEAIRKTFMGVGTSMIMTTMVLIAGFSTVLFSDMRDQRVFAAMGVITMFSALLGDLIFLPALLAYFAKPAPQEVLVLESAVSPEPAAELAAE